MKPSRLAARERTLDLGQEEISTELCYIKGKFCRKRKKLSSKNSISSKTILQK
jgi:hypothetical protein